MAPENGTAWDLLIARDDLARTELADRDLPEATPGDVVLRVDRVGMTANNVTYALTGDLLRYWSFFPADGGWGRVPLWGYADVVRSTVDRIDVGQRFYGYYPTSSHLVVRPDRVKEHGFRDVTDHRTSLPSAYNSYQATHADASYTPEDEDLQILYRPLFITALMLDDFLADNDFFGAGTLVTSSASSKTAYTTMFCTKLREERPKLVGLTSTRNVDFTTELGIYDEVVSYDDVGSMPAGDKTVYVDVAGDPMLRRAIHEHFGDDLTYDAMVGAAHGGALDAGAEVVGPEPKLFFAPSQIVKRREDWGPGGIEKLYADVWAKFAPVVRAWVDVVPGEGPEGLRAAWLEMLEGGSDPKKGHVIDL